jgi:hypothetical protein
MIGLNLRSEFKDKEGKVYKIVNAMGDTLYFINKDDDKDNFQMKFEVLQKKLESGEFTEIIVKK